MLTAIAGLAFHGLVSMTGLNEVDRRDHIHPSHPYALDVAASDFVVRAELMGVTERQGGEMLALDLRPIELVKGAPKDTMHVIAHLTLLSVSADAIRALRGKEVLALVVQRDDEVSGGLYLTPKSDRRSCSAISEYEEGRFERLREDVRWTQDVSERRPDESGSAIPHVKKVRTIIRGLLNKKTQERAIEQLMALDQSAVPALIALLDDRRPLPSGRVMLPTSSGFEAAVVYSPVQVIDLISIVLERLAGESFGHLHNGGSDRERDRVVKGWRVYLALERDLPPTA